MLNHLHIRADEITPIADPDTNGLLWVHPDAFGQAGVPYVIKVSDPPLSREISGLTVNNREYGTCSKAQ